MRLWTFHPKYLDPKGLTALWRESLLAKRVLCGATRGYRNHPQIIRFKSMDNPVGCISSYLYIVYEEAKERGYHFDGSKIGSIGSWQRIRTTIGQLEFEWSHFKEKLRMRDSKHLREMETIAFPDAHPVFLIVDGPKEEWERG